MSIKQAQTDVSITEKPTVDASSIYLPGFACPRDGTILELEHKNHDGRFECRKCRSLWQPQEVLVQ